MWKQKNWEQPKCFICRFKVILMRILEGRCVRVYENWQADPKIYMEMEWGKNSKYNLTNLKLEDICYQISRFITKLQ